MDFLMADRLTPKMQNVCLLYLKGMSMRQALLQAGYTESFALHHASKFLKSRACQKFIRERQAQAAEAALADVDFIKRNLMQLAESPDPQIRLAAIKQLDAHIEWKEELAAKREAKISEIEAAQKAAPQAASPVVIKIEPATK
jgi:phage terminase small subunit